MSPISSKTGSPMKTSSSLNVEEEDVTKAKKSRLAIPGDNLKIELPDYESSSSEEEDDDDDQEFSELKGKKEEEEDEDDNSKDFPPLATIKPVGRETLRATRSQTSAKKGSFTGDEISKRGIHDRLGDKTSRTGSIHERLGERASVHDRLGENTLKRPLSSASMRSSDSKPGFEAETDVTVLGRRQKQIEYGKNTPEYFQYAESVPRSDRKPFHPKTPNMHRKYSRRAWDGLVKQWRLNLHCWSQKAQDDDGGPEVKMELGESAATGLNLNESFHSESIETDSTSSSISAAFSVGVNLANQVFVKLEPKLEKDDDYENDQLGVVHLANQGFVKLEPKLENEDENENDELDTTMTESSQSQEKDDKLGTSWADEVEEEYYEGSDGEDTRP